MNSTNATQVAAATNNFEISQVSGYYGPGSVGAWLLLSLSCILATLEPHEPTEEVTLKRILHKAAINLDVDLLSVFAFPFIASVQALWIHGGYNDGTRDDMAVLAAPLIVISYARVVFSLLVACSRGQILRPRGRFMLVGLVYFSCLGTVLDLRCCEASWREYMEILPIPPHVHREDQQTGVCYQNLKQFYAQGSPALATGADSLHGHFGGSIITLTGEVYMVGAALYSAVFFAHFCWGSFLVKWTKGEQKGSWRVPWPDGSLWFRSRTIEEPGGAPGQFLLFFYATSANSILVLFLGRALMPPTSASIGDLDQVAAMVVGGVLPLMRDLIPSVSHYLTQWVASRRRPGIMPSAGPPPTPPLDLPPNPPRNPHAKPSPSRKEVRPTRAQTI